MAALCLSTIWSVHLRKTRICNSDTRAYISRPILNSFGPCSHKVTMAWSEEEEMLPPLPHSWPRGAEQGAISSVHANQSHVLRRLARLLVLPSCRIRKRAAAQICLTAMTCTQPTCTADPECTILPAPRYQSCWTVVRGSPAKRQRA